MGRSLLITGAILGSDVRLVVPDELRPPADVIEAAERAGGRLGRAGHDHRSTIATGVEGVDFVHTDVWVSMGEAKDVWAERAELLRPYPGQRRAAGGDPEPRVKFMHCLPAFHDAATTVGAEIAAATGMQDGLEVSDEVFRSPASIVFDQAENRLHTIKAVLVATLS